MFCLYVIDNKCHEKTKNQQVTSSVSNKYMFLRQYFTWPCVKKVVLTLLSLLSFEKTSRDNCLRFSLTLGSSACLLWNLSSICRKMRDYYCLGFLIDGLKNSVS